MNRTVQTSALFFFLLVLVEFDEIWYAVVACFELKFMPSYSA